jgi:hypothetical protein
MRCNPPLREAVGTRRGLLLVLSLLCGALPSSLHASLQVFPTRIVLTDQKRVASVSLRHLGDKEAAYRVSAVFYRMSPTGSMEIAADPTAEERSAVPLLRFSPRTTTIPPRREQVVQVMYIGPKNLPEGDYRAHLHFEPDFEEPEEVASAGGPAKGITLALKTRIAVAIPVIFRHGNPTSQVSLSDLQMRKTPSGLEVALKMLTRGNAFPFGDFEAFFTPKGGAPAPVGLIRGVASYLSERAVTAEITPGDVKLANGTLKVEFREPEVSGTKGKVLATAETAIP